MLFFFPKITNIDNFTVLASNLHESIRTVSKRHHNIIPGLAEPRYTDIPAFANSEDPDQLKKPTDLDLHCLPFYKYENLFQPSGSSNLIG